MPNDLNEVYYAVAKIPFPQSELDPLPPKERKNMFHVMIAQDNYCKSKLAEQVARLYVSKELTFTTGALSKSQWEERPTERADLTIKPNDIDLMDKMMTIRFHLKKTSTGFEAVAFESIGSREVVKLNHPLVTALTQERIAAAVTQVNEVHELKAEIKQLKMALGQLNGPEPATIAAPRRLK